MVTNNNYEEFDELQQKVLDALTTEHVIQILDEYCIEHKDDNNPKHIRCKTVCHGGNSFKLYYLKDKKFFYCFTECGGMSIFTLLTTINGWTFMQAFSYVSKIVGMSLSYEKPKTFGQRKKRITDWDFITKYKNNKKQQKNSFNYVSMPYNESVLQAFDKIYPSSWEKEYITPYAMDKFGIRFHTSEFSVIIPHYNIQGALIGIRSRHFLQYHIEAQRKYMPTILENEMYAHPLQFNLYGAYQNQHTIRKKKKALIVESEKSVMQCCSYYDEDNFTVAICGSTLSNYQRDMLVFDLDVDEVIIGLDKQYQNIGEYDENGEWIENEEHKLYITKVKKIADKLVNYVNVSIIYCTDDRLSYKDSPTDRGKEVLESLMKEKIRYYKEN